VYATAFVDHGRCHEEQKQNYTVQFFWMQTPFEKATRQRQ